jgi:peptidase M48-like protein
MNPFPSHRKVLFVLAAAFLLSGLSAGQLGLGKKKDKEVRTTDTPTELSDADKKKMAEIADRPEVKEEIQSAWDAKRQDDLEYAYNVNSSLHFSEMIGPQLAEFRQKYGQLYDNPILQEYLNNIGQHIVPADSPNTYSFKLLLDPVPRAESFSTGSVYISTGLVAMLDNEAQLAYILGHEIAHVEKNHFYNQIRNQILEQELYKEKEASTEKKRAIFTGVTALAGAGIGGGLAGRGGALTGGLIGFGGGLVGSQFLFRNKMTVTEWSVVYENEADDAGFKYMLDQSYDVREVPRLYTRLENTVTRDSRVGLGFISRLSRVKERSAHALELLNGSFKVTIDAKLKAGGLTGSSPEFSLIMAALKRDNGIIALDYDLYDVARDNLEEAVNLRSNDARAQYYLGRVISITARTPADRQQATAAFLKSIQYDEGRGAYPDPHLEHALSLIADKNSANSDEIRKELQTYVALYQREHAGQLPTNMPILYDYFTLAGDATWYVPPATVISTKNVEALRVNQTQNTGAANAKQVTQAAVGGDDSGSAKTVAHPAAVHPTKKPVPATTSQ